MENKEYKNSKFIIKEIKADEDNKLALVTGIANKIDIIDFGGDLTIAGAFDETVKVKPTVPALAYHQTSRPVGINRLSIASNGDLLTEMELNLEVQEAKELLALIKQFNAAGRPMELSIGYMVHESSFKQNEEQMIRVLEKVEVFEVSIVPFGMNEGSKVTSVKAKQLEKKLAEKDQEINLLKRELNLVKKIGGLLND